jgi:hypothetical protein
MIRLLLSTLGSFLHDMPPWLLYKGLVIVSLLVCALPLILAGTISPVKASDECRARTREEEEDDNGNFGLNDAVDFDIFTIHIGNCMAMLASLIFLWVVLYRSPHLIEKVKQAKDLDVKLCSFIFVHFLSNVAISVVNAVGHCSTSQTTRTSFAIANIALRAIFSVWSKDLMNHAYLFLRAEAHSAKSGTSSVFNISKLAASSKWEARYVTGPCSFCFTRFAWWLLV